ncbi:hypothetical protein ATPR_1741 [Acetobacter tropicalis NBRC 101654]|uniref:Uncharacterized protein n=1 Tax=Acetobacter tropicalis NBRC 101654 TaxID=749388 RepID=F7VEE2_9PROT|nr:hypothetical protein ATPR_1741 [Acetobacter tropicalis NBRC 101654]
MSAQSPPQNEGRLLFSFYVASSRASNGMQRQKKRHKNPQKRRL